MGFNLVTTPSRTHPLLPAHLGLFFSWADKSKSDSNAENLRQAIESACNKKTPPIINEYKPDHIVCTHFMPIQFLAHWKRKGLISMPVRSCVTDLVGSRFWLKTGLEDHFTAQEKNVWRMRSRGLENERIFATGIPVPSTFIPPADAVQLEYAHNEARTRFGLGPRQPPVALLMEGDVGGWQYA